MKSININYFNILFNILDIYFLSVLLIYLVYYSDICNTRMHFNILTTVFHIILFIKLIYLLHDPIYLILAT